MNIYADNAATTKTGKTAMDQMVACMETYFGNPSSLHTPGQKAAEKLADSRERIAKCLNATAREIYFTSGGSEADNQAIRSVALLGAKKGKKHIISTAFEHHAVLHTLDKLKDEGFDVTLLDVHEDGLITAEQVEKEIRPDTALVTVMFANNEIGTIQPIREIGEVCQKHGVIFHTDAVQAVGHIPVNVEEDHIDMLSLSAHKFHGPRGIGVLYVRKGIPLKNLIEGGAQERGKRAGTENLPAIAGMTVALEEACADLEKSQTYLTSLRDHLMERLSEIPHCRINGDKKKRLPGNINICFEGIEGESLLLLLDEKGIAASSGSACTSGSLDPSHVLLALGLPHEVAHGSLRLTFDMENTMQEMDYIADSVAEVVSYLRNMSPVWKDLENGKKKHLL